MRTPPEEPASLRPVHWVGSSREDLRAMPEDVRREVGRALLVAQLGGRARIATPLREFRGTSVLEIRDDYDSDTYRCVYTVQFTEAIYVLHAFQKKSRQGTKTPERELSVIRQRVQAAELDHRQRYGGG